MYHSSTKVLLYFIIVSALGGCGNELDQQHPRRQISLVSPSSTGQEVTSTNGVITVSTQSDLIAALANGNTINLSNDIYLTSSGSVASEKTGIIIRGITGLIINGNGFKLDGQNSVRCLYIGDQSDVSFTNLNVTGGFVVSNSF